MGKVQRHPKNRGPQTEFAWLVDQGVKAYQRANKLATLEKTEEKLAEKIHIGVRTLQGWRRDHIPKKYEYVRDFAKVCITADPKLGAEWIRDLFRVAGMANYCDDVVREISDTSKIQSSALLEKEEGKTTSKNLAIPPTWPENLDISRLLKGFPRKARVLSILLLSIGLISILLFNSHWVPLKSQEVTSMIKAGESWQSPELIEIISGDLVDIEAINGQWTINTRDLEQNPLVNANGYMGYYADWTPLSKAPVGALIGRIGEDTPFYVGQKQQIKAPSSGKLSLQINDWGLGDNSGEIIVQVTVH